MLKTELKPLYCTCPPADEDIRNLLKMMSIKFSFTLLYNYRTTVHIYTYFQHYCRPMFPLSCMEID